MLTAQQIIEKFGGADVCAEIADVTVNAVYRWTYPKENNGAGNTVPPKHHAALLKHAQEKGIALSYEELAGVC